MNKFKGTQGPWNINPKFKTSIHEEKTGHRIAVAVDSGLPGEIIPTTNANAKLIAAAPDMLECLLMFEKFDNVKLYSKAWERLAEKHLAMVEAAIKKATE